MNHSESSEKCWASWVGYKLLIPHNTPATEEKIMFARPIVKLFKVNFFALTTIPFEGTSVFPTGIFMNEEINI
jgi:hypothetical protein